MYFINDVMQEITHNYDSLKLKFAVVTSIRVNIYREKLIPKVEMTENDSNK